MRREALSQRKPPPNYRASVKKGCRRTGEVCRTWAEERFTRRVGQKCLLLVRFTPGVVRTLSCWTRHTRIHGFVAIASILLVGLAGVASASSSISTPVPAGNFSWTNRGAGFEPASGPSTAPGSGQQEKSETVFVVEPKPVSYVRAGNKPALVQCRAYAADLEMICAEESMNKQSVRRQLPEEAPDRSAGSTSGGPAAGARGIRTLWQIEANVTQQMVRDYFDAFVCQCVAYLDSDRQRKVTSSRGQVVLAFLDKSFRREPLSTYVDNLQQVELPCMAPEGVPPPSIFWLKNDKKIVPGANSSYIVTHDGSLIISLARQADEANYTCVAQNELGMHRKTDPAAVYINVHGGWTAWSSWSSTCGSDPCSAASRQQERRRHRECKNPVPRHHGRPCDGLATETAGCSASCGSGGGTEVTGAAGVEGRGEVGDGAWEPWGAWSECDSACQRRRSRTCGADSPARRILNGGAAAVGSSGDGSRANDRCSGPEFEMSNCTEPCRAEDREAMENIILYVSLCGAVALLAIILIVVVLCVMKGLSRRHARAGQTDASGATSRAGSYSPGSEKTHQSASEPTGRTDAQKSMIPMETPRPVAQWQDVGSSPTERAPMLPRSVNGGYYYASNVCQLGGAAPVTSSSAAPPPQIPPPLPPPRPVGPSVGSSCLAVGCSGPAVAVVAGDEYSGSLSSGRGSSGIEDAFDGCSTSSASERLLSNVDAQALCWSEVTQAGARLTLPGSGISLLIPEGALPHGGHEEAFVASLRDDKDRPPLLDKQTLLSPVLMCGPQQVALQRTPVLTFDHCANLKSGQWKLSLYSSSSPYDAEAPAWERLLTLNPDQSLPSSPAVYCHLDAGQCHVMLTRLASRYCLVGESAYGGKALKQLKLVAFAQPLPAAASRSACSTAAFRSQGGGRGLGVVEHCVRVYALPDTRDALQSVTHAEMRLGAKMIDKPKQLPFQDSSGGLCLAVDSLGPGWMCSPCTAQQEIPFPHIWNGSHNYPCCAFVFESGQDLTQAPLNCKIQAYQKCLPVGRQTLYIQCRGEQATLTKPGRGTHQSRLASSAAAASASSSASSSGCSSIVTLDGLPGGASSCAGASSSPRHHSQQQQQQALPLLPVRRLPPQLRAQLCELLDPPNQRQRADWRMLCAAMGADKHLGFFASRPSPTDAALQLWDALRGDDAPISDLTSMLRSIGRDDAAGIVEREFRGAPWV